MDVYSSIGGESFVMERERKRLTREREYLSQQNYSNTLHRVYTDRLSLSTRAGCEASICVKKEQKARCIQVIHSRLRVESKKEKIEKRKKNENFKEKILFLLQQLFEKHKKCV